METFIKDGVEVIMPDVDEKTMLEMKRCAEFIARMIEKYSKPIENKE